MTTNGTCSVEVYSRVTGFFRPIQTWNKGKLEEFADRNTFKITKEDNGETKDKGSKERL